ncbi:caspase family protein [Candidatus Amarolinea dominans]|uniref:caspase family protein n=1 Tax=Candidatus Amarolinea dominans TaxID=3140696 RepID=UPI001DC6DBC9|nr:caspase family protein [Anaerolineae bacterium]
MTRIWRICADFLKRDQWPTYRNMVMAFKQVTAMARPGDQVYIHYSGHGGRTITAYPEIKGPTGVDEGLVPLDIGDPNAQYLRDIELHTLIQNLVDKGVVLTVVFDCCHSGGATRALTQGSNGARARGIGKTDMTVRPLQPIVAPLDDPLPPGTPRRGRHGRLSRPVAGCWSRPATPSWPRAAPTSRPTSSPSAARRATARSPTGCSTPCAAPGRT